MAGVAQLHDVVYVILERCPEIFTFCATKHEFLTSVDFHHMGQLVDIAACELTSRLYIGDNNWYSLTPSRICRVSADLTDVDLWLPRSESSDAFRLGKLSVTSARLLVTPVDIKQLLQFDADGNEVKRIQLPSSARHAVESPTGTFIVSYRNLVREVNTVGEVLRQFSGSPLISLSAEYIAVDSQGNIFVADRNNYRILLLDSQLALRRVVIDEHQLNKKSVLRLCYVEQSGRLLVASYEVDSTRRNLAVFGVLRQ